MRSLLLAAALVAVSCGGAAQPAPAPLRTAAATVAPAVARTPAPTAAAFPCPTGGQPATKATIELVKGGSIVIALRADKAPCTVANFAKNAREGKYDGLTFHRVEPAFVIQGGDPEGTGRGGGNQATELSDLPFTTGAVGIARGGDIKVSNLMQFFACTGSCRHLDGAYTNFGQVTGGQDAADGVRVGDRIKTIRIE